MIFHANVMERMLEALQSYYSNLVVPDHLRCVSCRLVLKNAKQTPCGCRVCERCIKDHLSTGRTQCPGNESDCSNTITMDSIGDDNATNKEIANLPVTCPHEPCSFTSVLKNIESHIRNCEFQEIECNKCNERIVRKVKEIHHRQSCRKRISNCKYCEKETSIEVINTDHMDCFRKKVPSDVIEEDLIRIMLLITPIELSDLHVGLRCIICCSILQNAKQTSCGCRMCEACIEEYLSDGPKGCHGGDPDCIAQLTINDIEPDYAAIKEIRDLVVKCPSKSCSFAASLEELVKHIYRYKFLVKLCDQCNQHVIVCMEECHENDLGDLTRVTCDNCSKDTGICPNNCNIKSVVNLEDHLEKYKNWRCSDTFVESGPIRTYDSSTYNAWKSLFDRPQFDSFRISPTVLH